MKQGWCMVSMNLTEQDVISKIVVSNAEKRSLKESDIYKEAENTHYDCAISFKKLRDEKNIDSILRTEKFYLFQAQLSANSNAEKSSLNEGIRRVEEAEKSLLAVRNKETYNVRLQTASLKELDNEGLPKDSFRQFVTSQTTSIRNHLRAPLSKGEKAILEERISNLRAANEIYKGMQRDALSKPEHSKNQDTDNDFKTALQKAAQKAFPDNEEARKEFIAYATAQREVILKTQYQKKQQTLPKKSHEEPER